MQRLKVDVDSRSLRTLLWSVGGDLGTSPWVAYCRALLVRLLGSILGAIHVVEMVNIRVGWEDEMRSIRWLSIGRKRGRIVQSCGCLEIWMGLSALETSLPNRLPECSTVVNLPSMLA